MTDVYSEYDIPNNKEIKVKNIDTMVDTKHKSTNMIPFWATDPNVLFKNITEFFPTENMTYEQKLNAISRFIIVISLVSFFVSYNIRIIFVCAITLFSIFLLYTYNKDQINLVKESLVNLDNNNEMKLESIIHSSHDFTAPTSTNPFGNVMLPDYEYNVHRKPALPVDSDTADNLILDQAKQLVRDANPDQPDISDKLFKDLGDKYVFEQSLRQFTTNPNTTIPNDQGAFAQFCYGDMISCRDGDGIACLRNAYRYTNY